MLDIFLRPDHTGLCRSSQSTRFLIPRPGSGWFSGGASRIHSRQSWGIMRPTTEIQTGKRYAAGEEA